MKKVSAVIAWLLVACIATAQSAPITCPVIYQVLSKGSTDATTWPVGQVTSAQRFLRDYYQSTVFRVDGKYRQPTVTMVSLFQKDNGILPTGILGLVTRRKIFSLCGPGAQSTTRATTTSATGNTVSSPTRATNTVPLSNPAQTLSCVPVPTGCTVIGRSGNTCGLLSCQQFTTTNSNNIQTNITNTESCIFNGRVIPHASSTVSFLQSSVSFGSICTQEIRTCTNGILSGTYLNSLCTVGTSPVSCTWNGQTISSGQSVTAYQTSSVSFGNQCVTEQRTCTNGILSGTFSNVNCSVQTNTFRSGALNPRSITPVFALSASSLVSDAYLILLNRQADSAGQKAFMKTLPPDPTTSDVQNIFSTIMNSTEFAQLQSSSASAYVTRLYRILLQRDPSSIELNAQLQSMNITDTGNKISVWMNAYLNIVRSTEYLSRAPRTYYDYSEWSSSSPRLADLSSGIARWQTPEEATQINLSFTTPVIRLWDQKMPMWRDDTSGNLYAVTRLYTPSNGQEKYNLFLMKSSDNGITFSEVGPLFDTSTGDTYFDASLAIDRSRWPTRYSLVFECAPTGVQDSSSCISHSTTPTITSSWTKPVLLVAGQYVGDKLYSASTPVMVPLNSGGAQIYWTSVIRPVSGITGYVVSKGIEISAGLPLTNVANSTDGILLLNAEPSITCNSAWDCNNRNIQDVHLENDSIYVIYNGSNFWSCAASPTGNNDWGIALAKKSGLGLSQFSVAPSADLRASIKSVCGITYGNVVSINGDLYLYYAYWTSPSTNVTLRSKLIWK